MSCDCEEAVRRDGLCDERKHPGRLASSLLRGNNHRLLDDSQTILHRSDRPLDRPGNIETYMGSDGMSKTAWFPHLRHAGRRPGRYQYQVWHQPEDGCLEREWEKETRQGVRLGNFPWHGSSLDNGWAEMELVQCFVRSVLQTCITMPNRDDLQWAV